MAKVEIDQTLTGASPDVEFNLGNETNVADKTIYMKFTALGGDTPSVELYYEPVAGAGFVPFSKSPFDLAILSFNADCGGLGFNDLARIGKVKFSLVGAVNPGTNVRLIIVS